MRRGGEGGRQQQQRSGNGAENVAAGRPRRRSALALAVVALLFFSVPAVALAAPKQTAVFDFEIYDTSGEAVAEDLPQRLRRVSDELRLLLAQAPDDYALVDLSPAAERIDALGNRYGCNGCEASIAVEFGADVYVTGLIHKVSTLILVVRITVRDADTREVVARGVADIRGDNDRAWMHGVRWLVRNRILPGRR
ncbi:MAG: DUF3280 domain-containing protein [Inquilinus sp.]|nr:DUF3280 domain-containing protein [Inquilinus sp.]